ncbi:MAG: hypothetical protein RLZZ383_798 [Pseudomonadota bacterium]
MCTPAGEGVAGRAIDLGLAAALAPGWHADPIALRIGRYGRLDLEGFRLLDPDGTPSIAVGALTLDLDVSWARLAVRRLQITRPEVILDTDADGLRLARAFGPPRPKPARARWAGLPFALEVTDAVLASGRVQARRLGSDGTWTTTLDVADLDLDLPTLRALPGAPTVQIAPLTLDADLAVPAARRLAIEGPLTYDDGDLALDGLRVTVGRSHVGLYGSVSVAPIDGPITVAASLQPDPIDLGDLDPLIHAHLGGTWRGLISAQGPLTSLGLHGAIEGVDATTGHLALLEGSTLCLPIAHPDADDRCGGPAGDDPELRWTAAVDATAFPIGEFVPPARGPLVVTGRVQATGGGTRWPGGFWLRDGHLDVVGEDVFGVPLRRVTADVAIEDGVVQIATVAASGLAGSAVGTGTYDTRDGRLDGHGDLQLDLGMLTDLGVAGLASTGHAAWTLQGDTFAPGHPIRLQAAAELPSLDVEAADLHARGLVVRAEAVVANGRVDIDVPSLTGRSVRLLGDMALQDATASATVEVHDGVVGVHGVVRARAMDWTDDVHTGPVTTTLTAAWSPQGLDLGGDAHVPALGWTDDVVLRSVDATWATHTPRDRDTTVDVRARAASGEAWGAVLRGVDAPDVAVQVGREVVATGTLGLQGADYEGWAGVASASSRFRFVLGEGGHLRLDAPAHLEGVRVFDAHDGTGDAILTLVDDQLTLQVAADRRGVPVVAVPDLTWDLTAGRLGASTLAVGMGGDVVWKSETPWHLTLTDDGIRDADLVLTVDDGRIGLFGTLGTTGALAGSVRFERFDLGALARLDPAWAGTAGRVEGQMRLDGDAAHPRLQSSLSVEGLTLPGTVRRLDLAGDLGVVDDVATIDLQGRVGQEPLFRLRGDAPVVSDLAAPALSTSGTADLRAWLVPTTTQRLRAVLPSLQAPEATLSAALHVSGDLRDPALWLAGVAELPMDGVSEPLRLELSADRVDERLTLRAEGYEGLAPRLRASATARTQLADVMAGLLGSRPLPDLEDASVYVDDLDASVELLGLPLPTLAQALGVPADVSGVATGRIHAAGAVAEPTLDAALAAYGLAGGTPFQADLTLTPRSSAPKGYDLLWTLRGDVSDLEPWLSVSGEVPASVRPLSDAGWAAHGPLDLAIDGAGLPIAVGRLFTDDLVPLSTNATDRRRRDAFPDPNANRIRATGHVRGPIDDPVPSLDVLLDGAHFAWRPLGLALRDGHLALHVGPDGQGGLVAQLDGLSAQTGPQDVDLAALLQTTPSRVSADGFVRFVQGRPDAVQLSVNLRETWLVHRDDQRLRASGALAVEGRFPRLTATGNLIAEEASVRLDTSELLATRELAVDPSIVIHRQRPAPGRERGGTASLPAAPRSAVSSTTPAPSTTPALSLSEEALAGLDLGVHIDLGRNTRTRIDLPVFDDLGSLGARVTRAEVDAQLSGEVDVGYRAGEPSVAGELTVPNGEFGLLASKFAIQPDSRLVFTGRSWWNPILDLSGKLATAGGDVDLKVGGTAEQPTVDFSSEDFSSEAELLTVLLTGRSPTELSSSEGRYAAEALSELLVDSVLGGIELGSVSVEPDGTLVVGLPVFDTVYLESRVNPFQQLNENAITVNGEWRILPKLVLQGSYGNRKVWALLGWEHRF